MTSNAKDRLKELQQAQDVEINVPESEQVDPQLKEVFDKVYVLRNFIAAIKENTKKSRELIKANSIPNKIIVDEIESRYKETINIAFKITNELKALDVTESKKDKNNDKSVLARVKRIQYGSLRQEFQNAIFESNQLLENYREQRRHFLKRQAALVHMNLDDEELESLLDKADVSQLFAGNILLETKIAKDELSLIEERHAELLKIESMLVEVNDQFKQVAILVEQQKEHIDRIEFHASDAINYVDKGLVEIQKAEESKKRNKKMLIIIISVAVLVIIIIMLLLLK